MTASRSRGLGSLRSRHADGTFFPPRRLGRVIEDGVRPQPLITPVRPNATAPSRRAAAGAGEDAAVRQHADFQRRSASMAAPLAADAESEAGAAGPRRGAAGTHRCQRRWNSAICEPAATQADRLGRAARSVRDVPQSRSRPTTSRNMKAIPRKQRAMVRKGIQNGLTSVAEPRRGRAARVYAESVRNLGTPVFSRRYFRIADGGVRRRCRYRHDPGRRTPIASVMNFYFRDEVLPYYGGGTSGGARPSPATISCIGR